MTAQSYALSPGSVERNQLAANLRLLRQAYGLSVRDVATDLEVAPASISRWETADRSPSQDNLEALAAYYEVSVAKLLR